MDEQHENLSTQTDGKVVVVAKPPLIYLISIGAGLVLQAIWSIRLLSGSVGVWIGLGLIVVAVALALVAEREFQRWKTAVNHDYAPTTLVKTGPYRYSRNPMYVSLTTLQIGVALATNSLWVLLTLVPALIIMHHGVILREEQYMARKFGAAYQTYRSSVRRWL
jgi:protein-S-isoprenylcysteine O-methyltransferase Ste14